MTLVASFPFEVLRGFPDPRPVARVSVDGLRELELPCMLDSGSRNTLMPAWVAREAQVPVDGAPSIDLAIGGHVLQARFAVVRMFMKRHTWETEVGFCERWPWDHMLLGLNGFFRWFDVTISVASQRTTMVPVD